MLPAIGTALANPATTKVQVCGIRMTSSFSISRPRPLSPHSASGRSSRIFLSAFVRIDGVALVQLDISPPKPNDSYRKMPPKHSRRWYDLFSAVLHGSASIGFRSGGGERFVFHMSIISYSCPKSLRLMSPSNHHGQKILKKTLNNAKKHFIMVQLSSIQDWRCGVASTTLRVNCNTATKSRGVAMEQLSNMIF